jgi:hypothetical protein
MRGRAGVGTSRRRARSCRAGSWPYGPSPRACSGRTRRDSPPPPAYLESGGPVGWARREATCWSCDARRRPPRNPTMMVGRSDRASAQGDTSRFSNGRALHRPVFGGYSGNSAEGWHDDRELAQTWALRPSLPTAHKPPDGYLGNDPLATGLVSVFGQVFPGPGATQPQSAQVI